MATTKGGLLNHHIREVAWPILASLHNIDDDNDIMKKSNTITK